MDWPFAVVVILNKFNFFVFFSQKLKANLAQFQSVYEHPQMGRAVPHASTQTVEGGRQPGAPSHPH